MKRLTIAIVALLIATLSTASFARYPYWEQRQSQFELLPVNSNDIIFLGNSLTDAGKWAEMFNMPNVKNRGIVSDVIEGVASRTQCITSGAPSKIFLLIGVNDVSHHLTADSIATAVEKLVQKIKSESPATEIYLQSYFPINNDFGVYKTLLNESETILKCNVLLEQIAERNNLTWINIFPKLMDRDCKLRKELTADGLHLNEAGYKIWRDAVAPYVNSELKLTDEVYPVPTNSILVIGNSLARHGEWHELLNDGRVKSRGTWLDTSRDLSLLTDVMAHYHPAKMFIQTSYNQKGEKVNLDGNFDIDSIIANTDRALKAIKDVSPETVIYLESLVPVNSTYDNYKSFACKKKEIDKANKRLQKLAKKYKAEWINITEILSDDNGDLKAEFTNDGFSLTGAGYVAWANALKPYL